MSTDFSGPLTTGSGGREVGDHYRKVSPPAGSPRGGLSGNGRHSRNGQRWYGKQPSRDGVPGFCATLVHNPPPPAPANVPQISRLEGKPLTKRQKLAAHMEEAQCASCHRKMDPIGFGMENFTASGKVAQQGISIHQEQKRADGTKQNFLPHQSPPGNCITGPPLRISLSCVS